jgi:hypothetical protein
MESKERKIRKGDFSMKKGSKKLPVLFSRALAILLLITLLSLTTFLPPVVNNLYDTFDLSGNRQQLPEWNRTLFLVCAYLMITVAIAAIVFLWLLLDVTSHGKIFSSATTKLLSALSICCFGEAVLFLAIQHCFELAIGGALVAALLGLCLLVVRNVLAEATRIKQENDFTV